MSRRERVCVWAGLVVLGGSAAAPLVSLPYPVFSMAFDASGSLWAVTGGGPLLQLDPETGQTLNQFGEGLTLAIAIEPETGRIFVSKKARPGVTEKSRLTVLLEHRAIAVA